MISSKQLLKSSAVRSEAKAGFSLAWTATNKKSWMRWMRFEQEKKERRRRTKEGKEMPVAAHLLK